MVNSVILEYLEKYGKKYGVEDLKRKIVSSGYSEEDVEEALDALGLRKQEEEVEKSAPKEVRVEIAKTAPESAFKKSPAEDTRVNVIENMAEAGKKPIFMKVFSVIIIILLANVAFFIFRYGNLNKGLTGFSVKEILSNSYQALSPFAKMILIGQWVALILILAAVYLRDKNIGLQQDEVSDIEFKKMNTNKGTDLDVLYNVLKEKKHLRVSTISKLFDVKKGTALEWCKILESGNLAIIDYPSSREPVVNFVAK